MISTPCVISLQGLLIPYADSFFGGLSPIDVWRSERFIEVATRRGLLWRYRDYREAARREREILAGAKIVLGRTDWDRMHAWSVNPRAEYLHVGEVLRKDFQQAHWDVNQCERHSIIFTNAGDPRRGTETLLRALMIVRQEFPGAKLRLAGGLGTRYGYDRFLRRMIVDNNLSDSVEYLGRLDAGAMAKELSRSHVFAIASYIENSPNSLCEAMQVGMPCVASYVGGIPNLVDAGDRDFCFPPATPRFWLIQSCVSFAMTISPRRWAGSPVWKLRSAMTRGGSFLNCWARTARRRALCSPRRRRN